MNYREVLPRHELALWFSKLLIVLLVLATAIRPLIVSLDPLFTWVGLVDTVLAIGTYLLVRSNRVRRWEGALVIAVALAFLVPMLLVSGGIDSQFAYLIPVFPLGASMLGGRSLTLGVCAIWLVILLGLLLAGPVVPDITGAPYHAGKSLARGFWLLMALGTAGAAGLYFDRAYRRLAGELHEQATFDHLTGVVNRRALDAMLNRELKRMRRTGSPLAVMMVDVDHFKAFNDRYGHAVGDQCLVAIARCLQSLTREGQDVVGRYGGEEFLVVLTDTDLDKAHQAAEKLREAVSTLRPGQVVDRITVTIGIAGTGNDPDIDRETLVRRADQALYAGKASGRDQVARHAPGAGEAATPRN